MTDAFASRIVRNKLAAQRSALVRDAQYLADTYRRLAAELADENHLPTVPTGDSSRAAAAAQQLAQGLAELRGMQEIADTTLAAKEN